MIRVLRAQQAEFYSPLSVDEAVEELQASLDYSPVGGAVAADRVYVEGPAGSSAVAMFVGRFEIEAEETALSGYFVLGLRPRIVLYAWLGVALVCGMSSLAAFFALHGAAARIRWKGHPPLGRQRPQTLAVRWR